MTPSAYQQLIVAEGSEATVVPPLREAMTRAPSHLASKVLILTVLKLVFRTP